MTVFKIARFRVPPEHIAEAEAAIAEFAAYVGESLSDSSWSAWRADGRPGEYVALIRADDEAADARHREAEGTERFVARPWDAVLADGAEAKSDLLIRLAHGGDIG